MLKNDFGNCNEIISVYSNGFYYEFGSAFLLDKIFKV